MRSYISLLQSRLSWGTTLNGAAIVAFVLGLLCLALPNLQVMMDFTLFNSLLAPLYLLIGIHIGGVYWLLSIPLGLFHSMTGTNGFTWLVACCLMLWLAIVWVWLCLAVFGRKTSLWRGYRFRWLMPLLLGLLSLLWISRIPLSLTFAYHKPALEKLADQVMVAPVNSEEFVAPRQLGLFQVYKASRLSPTIVSLPIDSHWAAQGFVRDLSRQPNQLAANTYSLAPSSNSGDQELFYLGDGWYVFQNLFD